MNLPCFFSCVLPTANCLLLSLPRMDEPEYLICLQCETPTYQFDYANGKLASIVCTACGNDDVSDFATEAEYEEMS